MQGFEDFISYQILVPEANLQSVAFQQMRNRSPSQDVRKVEGSLLNFKLCNSEQVTAYKCEWPEKLSVTGRPFLMTESSF